MPLKTKLISYFSSPPVSDFVMPPLMCQLSRINLSNYINRSTLDYVACMMFSVVITIQAKLRRGAAGCMRARAHPG